MQDVALFTKIVKRAKKGSLESDIIISPTSHKIKIAFIL